MEALGRACRRMGPRAFRGTLRLIVVLCGQFLVRQGSTPSTLWLCCAVPCHGGAARCTPSDASDLRWCATVLEKYRSVPPQKIKPLFHMRAPRNRVCHFAFLFGGGGGANGAMQR